MRTPSLRRHKARSLGVVTLNGHDHYLGSWPAEKRKPPPAVQAEYDRLIAEWLANGRRPLVKGAAPSGPTVGEVILGFWAHAQRHYRHEDGTSTTEVAAYRDALRPLRDMYSTLPAADCSPLKLKAVRQRMVDAGLTRALINRRVGKVVRMFKWAVAEELVPVEVYQALRAVPGLQKGRCDAKEAPPVLPVEDERVEATLPHLLPTVAAMVRLQRLTGMRPGEVCALRPCDLDTTGPVWLYRPGQHKTKHRGKARVVALGPKAQEVLRPRLRHRCPLCGVEGLPDEIAWRESL
jgi:integrase